MVNPTDPATQTTIASTAPGVSQRKPGWRTLGAADAVPTSADGPESGAIDGQSPMPAIWGPRQSGSVNSVRAITVPWLRAPDDLTRNCELWAAGEPARNRAERKAIPNAGIRFELVRPLGRRGRHSMDPLHARPIEEIHIPRAPCRLVIPEAEQGPEGRRDRPAFLLPEVSEARVGVECPLARAAASSQSPGRMAVQRARSLTRVALTS
jgi:hypothetical protein